MANHYILEVLVESSIIDGYPIVEVKELLICYTQINLYWLFHILFIH